MTWIEIWRRDIFRPKDNFSQRKQHFHIQRRPKCYSPTLRTPSPMLSHQLHCHDYQDNMYIFTYTFYLYVLCTIKHPKRIRFTYTFCVQLDVLNAVCFSVHAPLARFTYTFNFPIRIRITYTFNVVAPLASPFNPLYVYILLIRITYTLYLYVLHILYTYM